MEKKPELEKTLFNLSNDHEPALEELFNYYYPRLYRFARSFLKIEDGIEDILQEVFIRVWDHRRKIRNTATFNAFIFTISRNLLLNELRNRLKDQKVRETLLKKSIAEEFMVSGEVDFRELESKVEEIITQLPDNHREYFVMSRKEGLSNRAIAEKMGVSEKNVEYHLSRAVKILKEKLKDLGMVSFLYFYLFL
ncbi:MAG TPA: RNA polymerase sigma-70 factor [Prolixibacteraceae bacterium]|jgi:RNA polymerase sigma-70 factor (ECF subfamily)|nr:RNA polymerase sigma-70 factor [Bacteroidales bacterium]HOY50637.1 RNA polymerase sigma-70 factor [Prolixibacteraceae bacterium]HPJ77473.1 RNA polymerase sigma-70 factor [Prolixibacteraceae bacterium]HRV88021.1 RNA polymerase sigma-70 factor [Prolixibacteraceae bacterium]